jgi:signal transduction histidine kinase
VLRVRRRKAEEYRRATEIEAEERRRANAAADRAESERHEQSIRYRTFAHIITHDLKNPINAIYLTADFLLTRHARELSPGLAAAITRIQQMAEGAEAKIFDLMNLYRIVSTPEPGAWVDFNELADEAVRDLREQIDTKAIHLDLERLPIVWGQYEKLGYVVANLLSNAIKFVPTGSGRVAVRAEPEATGVTLVVEDNGIGIPEAYHERIFELFARVPESERGVDGVPPAGTGVGLALVKRIVELHHGRISVQSQPRHGSRFSVWLPAGRQAHLDA